MTAVGLCYLVDLKLFFFFFFLSFSGDLNPAAQVLKIAALLLKVSL